MNYWVVGAMFGGREDQYETFVQRRYWYCWDPRKKREDTSIPPEVEARFPQIQSGDRIAIKRLLGRGSSDIEIRAVGIVKDVDLKEWRVYVDWLITGLNRRVPLHGCAGAIHGPFLQTDEWTRLVFQL